MCTLLSLLAEEATRVPSGDQATLVTALWWLVYLLHGAAV